MVASPPARTALTAQPEAGPAGRSPATGCTADASSEREPQIDALVFSADDRDERAWAELAAGRSRLLVATEGAGGGNWWGDSEGRWQAAAPPGSARDTYGCGDSFAAGFTFALAQRASVPDAAAFAARCGAQCPTRRGGP